MRQYGIQLDYLDIIALGHLLYGSLIFNAILLMSIPCTTTCSYTLSLTLSLAFSLLYFPFDTQLKLVLYLLADDRHVWLEHH